MGKQTNKHAHKETNRQREKQTYIYKTYPRDSNLWLSAVTMSWSKDRRRTEVRGGPFVWWPTFYECSRVWCWTDGVPVWEIDSTPSPHPPASSSPSTASPDPASSSRSIPISSDIVLFHHPLSHRSISPFPGIRPCWQIPNIPIQRQQTETDSDSDRYIQTLPRHTGKQRQIDTDKHRQINRQTYRQTLRRTARQPITVVFRVNIRRPIPSLSCLWSLSIEEWRELSNHTDVQIRSNNLPLHSFIGWLYMITNSIHLEPALTPN